MATTSTLGTARAAIQAALDTGLLQGKSHYAWPGPIVSKGHFEGVWIAGVDRWSHVIPNIKAGRKQRQEEYVLRGQLWVAKPDVGADGAQVTFERALALFAVVEDALANDVQLDETDIQWLQLDEHSPPDLIPYEKGWACLIEFRVRGQARLT